MFIVKSNQKRNNMEKIISYTEAIRELETIVAEIEEGEITIDTLSEKVKRASELIKICKDKLSATEADVNKILGEMKEE
jgi:exodeoxyribonuclease VII small subunit